VLGGLLLNTHIDIAALSGLWLLALPLFFLGLLFVAFGLNRVRKDREAASDTTFEEADEEPILE
jgi:cbb3-type cytochrome oxidase subunit 3